MSRQFLVTKFVCSVCGGNLSVSYDVPKGAGQHSPGEPTGADIVEQLVAVEPCAPCAAPLKAVQSSLRTLIGVAGSAT